MTVRIKNVDPLIVLGPRRLEAAVFRIDGIRRTRAGFPNAIQPGRVATQHPGVAAPAPELPSQSPGLFDPLTSVMQSSCEGRFARVALNGGVGVCMVPSIFSRQKQPISLNP